VIDEIGTFTRVTRVHHFGTIAIRRYGEKEPTTRLTSSPCQKTGSLTGLLNQGLRLRKAVTQERYATEWVGADSNRRPPRRRQSVFSRPRRLRLCGEDSGGNHYPTPPPSTTTPGRERFVRTNDPQYDTQEGSRTASERTQARSFGLHPPEQPLRAETLRGVDR